MPTVYPKDRKSAIGKKLGSGSTPTHAPSSNTLAFGQPNQVAKKEGWEKEKTQPSEGTTDLTVEALVGFRPHKVVRRTVIEELLYDLSHECSFGVSPTVSVILRVDGYISRLFYGESIKE